MPHTSSNAVAPTAWHIGTMGFSYPDWAGPFYPPGLRAGDYLSYYSQFFDTVELDTTFYAAPPVERVERWRDETPEHFHFSVKTPRAITHDAPLSAGVDAMRRFVDVCRVFENKLGAILIQFAPSFAAEHFSQVDTFLATLPDDLRFAVEFRHRTWGQPQTLQMLHDRRCAFVSAEYATRPSRVFATADWLYLRWIGVHDRFVRHEREQADVSNELDWWRTALEPALPKVREVWGYFNNDYAGYSPATAHRFRQMMGLPSTDPSVGKTGELF